MQENDRLMKDLISRMTEPLRSLLHAQLGDDSEQVVEIRLHCGRPVQILFAKDLWFVGKTRLEKAAAPDVYCPSRRELAELLARLSDYALYSKEQELRSGYLTVQGGHRIGVCTGYLASGSVDFAAIGALNIRVAHAVVGCADAVCKIMRDDRCRGVLLAGPPLSGKTTVLRDAVRQLSAPPHNRKISVVDERREIAACCDGVPTLDVGFCDVLDGFSKTEGIGMALRALSPHIVACDELSDSFDAQSLRRAALGGVVPLATVHASGCDEILKKAELRPLFESGCISHIVLMGRTPHMGSIRQVLRVDGC